MLMSPDGNKKEEIIKAATSLKFQPVEITSIDRYHGYKRIPLTEIAGLGSGFSEMIPAFRTVTETTTVNTEGLWRCSFPEGVSGHLAAFKDGSGNLGTIMNENGIVGQARWNPAGPVSATKTAVAPISPVTLFMAAALIEINHKLDKIQKLGEEILSYLKEKDRAEQEANFEELQDIYNKFKYNLKDEKWQMQKYNKVQDIRTKTSAQIKLLRSQIEKTMDRHDLVHSVRQTKEMRIKVENDFRYYRLGVFMYSFATFLEILLHGNFNKEYLDAVKKDIEKYAIKFKEFYTECYNKLERSSKSTIESKMAKGIAKASGTLGKTIHSIPIIEKGPVDEALISAGKSVEHYDKKFTEDSLKNFTTYNDSGTRQFKEGIKSISRLYNDPMEVLLDEKNLYIKIGKAAK